MKLVHAAASFARTGIPGSCRVLMLFVSLLIVLLLRSVVRPAAQPGVATPGMDVVGRCVVSRRSDGDDDLPSGVAGPDVAEGLGRLARSAGAVGYRREFRCLEKLGQIKQALALHY